MKTIAILLAFTAAALAQQPARPPMLSVRAGNADLRILQMEAIYQRCPQTVRVTDVPEKADYRLEVHSSASMALLFNREGELLADFPNIRSSVAQTICQYFATPGKGN